MAPEMKSLLRCPMCGGFFEAQQGQAACDGCFFSGRCDWVRCPHCSYEVSPQALQIGRRPLTDLKEGTRTVVEDLSTTDATTLRQFIGMGLLPGATIRVLQRFPSWRLEVNQAQVALDSALAGAVWVKS